MNKVNKSVVALRVVVCLIAVAGIGVWAWRNFIPTEASPETQKASATTDAAGSMHPSQLINESGHAVLVTYFTSNVRCPTCLKIEKLTQESIEKSFAKELATKEVVFQTINFDKVENKHFVKDYQLAFKTVVISELKNGKEVQWSKYDKVWDLVNSPEPFNIYLTDGIQQYLTKK